MSASAKEKQANSDLDLFSVAQVANPYPALDELREYSPAVYMSSHDYWLLTRYADMKAATEDWQTYTSAHGVGIFGPQNENVKATLLGTDPPEHDRLRAILSEKLAPRALRSLRDGIETKANGLVTELVGRGRFDGVVDLARVFPIEVVADLIGLPSEGRERLHPGADAVFTAFGPYTPILEERLPAFHAYWQYIADVTSREHLAPGSWGAEVQDAVNAGRLTMSDAISTLGAFLTAGMDTTVNAIAALLQLFAERPDIWEALRQDPSRAGAVFEEVLRMETPVQGFFRVTTREVVLGEVTIPAEQRVMLHWAAGNRDPRHYPNPHVFDIQRNPLDHLAFGYGTHGCVGQGLARMEVKALLEALISQVRRFELTGEAIRRYNPVVRSLDSVPLAVAVIEQDR